MTLARRPERTRLSWVPVFVIAACIFVGARPDLGAQANSKKPSKNQTPTPALPQITWPLPPEQPRIRYLTTYRGVDDFKRAKKPSKLMTMLLGAQDAGSQPSDSMLKPYGIAVSATRRIYVADTAARRVFVFNPDAGTVDFLGETGAGKLTKPIGVAVDDRGVVFVADGTVKRVFAYAPNGTLVLAIGHDGELANPSGLAVDRVNKRVYVADATRHQILIYSSEDGSALGSIGKRGSEPGEFNFPTNLAVDARGRLLVTDTLNFRIQIFNLAGKFVKTFGVLGDEPGRLNRPKGIGVDSEGHIYVVDSSFNNFQIFDEDGQLLLFVGAGGRNAGEFFLPAGLYIDEQDRIYVADQGNSRVQVFQYLPTGTGRPGRQEGAIR
jgi:DNA-binding beta-propeller fold protein YncE